MSNVIEKVLPPGVTHGPYKGEYAALDKEEMYWVEQYLWLLEKGYQLRPRYHPNWTPSWWPKRFPPRLPCEDAKYLVTADKLNDATRLADGAHVVLKRVPHRILHFDTEEASILEYFSQAEVASDPRNHCVPCIEILRPPNDDKGVLAVMPILRKFDDPAFETKGEAVDFIRQVLVGFEFLHEHRVAHRDIRTDNIMLDGQTLGVDKFHHADPSMTYNLKRRVRFKKTRTKAHPRYYIIDFGFSTHFAADDMPPRTLPRPASDQSLPELNHMFTPCDPFAVDVYYVGSFLRMEFIEGSPITMQRNGREGYEFLRPLIDAMTKENPKDRVTMTQSIKIFDEIVSTLSTSTLRSQDKLKYGRWLPQPNLDTRIANRVRYWGRRTKYTIFGVPPTKFAGET